MNRAIRNLLVVTLLAATTASGIWYYNRPKPVFVMVKQAEKGLVEETVANTRAGTVKACRRAKLSPGIGGQIAILDIREGDQVKSGALLLELWNKDLMAQIELDAAQAKAASASARAACLQAEVAKREADRRVRLRKTGAVSEDAVDKAVTDAKARRADCESANAKALVSNAQIAVARSKVEKTQLIAPFDGVVAEINGELNEYVTPSPPGIPTPPAVDLIDNSCFYVAAPIDEVDAPKVKIGQTARVTLDAFNDHRFPGTVRRIAAYVLDREKQARTVEVEVEFSRKDDIQQLLAGYSADVEIILDARKEALRIPTEAVLDESRVLVFLPDDGLLEERTVTTGMSNWDHTEVLSGIEDGELVVTSVDKDGVENGALAQRSEEEQK
ncbi:MAG: efflux RND transporter periplasmic adaptor subunit [Chromatiales bacterium]|nr:efflux RND transporter periplasmic adaptor subunit [Chromatiales bacterium]